MYWIINDKSIRSVITLENVNISTWKKCKIHTGLIHTQHCRKQDGHGVK